MRSPSDEPRADGGQVGQSIDGTARGFPDAGDVRKDPETLEKWCQECGRTLPSSRGFSWCPYCADGQPPTPNPCYRSVQAATADGGDADR